MLYVDKPPACRGIAKSAEPAQRIGSFRMSGQRTQKADKTTGQNWRQVRNCRQAAGRPAILPVIFAGDIEWRAVMAGSVNKVILVGNLGKDPEIRRTQDGRPIANLSIATSETWRDKGTGERKEKTEWHRVVIFNEAALQDRRAVSEEGRQGLHRGRAADPQMDRPERRREILDRSRAAGLQLDPDHARRPQRRRWRQLRLRRFGGDFGSSAAGQLRAAAAAAAGGRNSDMDDDIPF